MKKNLRDKVVHKKVVDGVYDTSKMLLQIGDECVTKHFKSTSNSTTRRYHLEKQALSRLENTPGTPSLYHHDDNNRTLQMSRLPGVSATYLSVQNLMDLAVIVKNMLASGVARHSMPIRDIVVDEGGQLGLVDFERTTLCKARWRPDWLIAKAVTRYHLYRLMSQYQPQMLNRRQFLLVEMGSKLRGFVFFIHSLSN